MEENYLRSDHFIAYFDKFYGKNITGYPAEHRPQIIETMKKSILEMTPSPGEGNIYERQDSIAVLWFFPCPIFFKSQEELDKVKAKAEAFIATNPICQGTCGTISFQDYDAEGADLKVYQFYRILGLRLGLDE